MKNFSGKGSRSLDETRLDMTNITRLHREAELPRTVKGSLWHISIVFETSSTARMTSECQKRREDYTVGVVCALYIELAAVLEMLDHKHAGLTNAIQDSNTYILGSIGKHNVVIACLPEGQTGTNSAAGVATQMMSAFPLIRFGLMIGVGGGVPRTEADIRLGDVVVSRPGNGHGGVVQYDFGKTTSSGIERTGFLNMPPSILLTAVATLRAKYMSGERRSLEYPSKLNVLEKFAGRNTGPDLLFKATYNHVRGDTCQTCNEMELVKRQPRDSQEIIVHYGTIASGNQVMRDATERDKISSDLGGVLCFEMEAAGLMNAFPCLVIRGICDYAESHKNKNWQPYAAGAATVYAKELLSLVPAADVAISRTINEIFMGNNDLTPQEICLLLKKARAQDESGRIIAQKCFDKSKQSDQIVSDAISSFLIFLYGLLCAIWAPSFLFSQLNQALDRNFSQMESLIISDKKLANELKQEEADIRDTLAQLDDFEEQIKNETQTSQRNSNTGNTEINDAQSQVPTRFDQTEQKSNEISQRSVESGQQAELYAECSSAKEQLQHTAMDINQKATVLDAQAARREKLMEEAEHLRAATAGRSFWGTVGMWIAWLLNCGREEES